MTFDVKIQTQALGEAQLLEGWETFGRLGCLVDFEHRWEQTRDPQFLLGRVQALLVGDAGELVAEVRLARPEYHYLSALPLHLQPSSVIDGDGRTHILSMGLFVDCEFPSEALHSVADRPEAADHHHGNHHGQERV